MLRSSSRIRASSFDTTLKNTRSMHGRFVSISYFQSPTPLGEGRFAIVASKAVAKQAVARNKLRRWGYSLVREFNLNQKKGLVCIIFFKKGAKDIKFDELKDDLEALFRKA